MNFLNDKKDYVLLLLIFFGLSLMGIYHHEIWLDESQHWLLARDSVSLYDLWLNTRYEGHPIAWNVLLYYVTRVTVDPIYMQLLHIGLSLIVVGLFLFNAPFKLVFKVLFIFGYFVLYEYNILSRNYMLGVLFLFFALSYFKDRKNKVITIAFLLVLSMNTHALFAILSIALALFFLFERKESKTAYLTRDFLIASGVFIVGLLFFLWQVIPPEDTIFFNRPSQSWSQRLSPAITFWFKGLFPIPDYNQYHFWNTNLFFGLSKRFSVVLSVISFGIPWLLFRKNKKVFCFVYIAIFGTMLFFVITQMSANRYFGIAFFILITGLWIEKYYPNFSYSVNKKIIVYGILVIQVFAGIFAYYQDWVFPFSSSKEVVKIIDSNNKNSYPMVTLSCQGTKVSAYLRKKVYFLCDKKEQSYCTWGKSRRCLISYSQLQSLKAQAKETPVIFISDTPLTNTDNMIKLLGKTKEAIIKQETFYVYEIQSNK